MHLLVMLFHLLGPSSRLLLRGRGRGGGRRRGCRGRLSDQSRRNRQKRNERKSPNERSLHFNLLAPRRKIRAVRDGIYGPVGECGMNALDPVFRQTFWKTVRLSNRCRATKSFVLASPCVCPSPRGRFSRPARNRPLPSPSRGPRDRSSSTATCRTRAGRVRQK